MSKAISSMMSAQTTTAKMDATIAQVEALMQDKGISALPIVEGEGGTAIGIISTRDLIRFHNEMHKNKRDANTVQAWEICSYKPISVVGETAIKEVARLMVDNGFHHILVTQEQRIIGIVSSLDFVRKCARAED